MGVWWDIIPRSPFVSMNDISRLSWNLENADLRAREEENGLWIMEYSRFVWEQRFYWKLIVDIPKTLGLLYSPCVCLFVGIKAEKLYSVTSSRQKRRKGKKKKKGTKNAPRCQVPIWRDHKIGPRTAKMAIVIPRRRRGTWEEVTVATWCSEWICRMWGGLGHHTLIFPALLSLPPMRGAAIGCTPTMLQNDSFYTRISNFVQFQLIGRSQKSMTYVLFVLLDSKQWLPRISRGWSSNRLGFTFGHSHKLPGITNGFSLGYFS